MQYGVLNSSTNNGYDDELIAVFAAPLSVISNTPIFAGETLSLKRITISQNVQRWEIESEFNPTIGDGRFVANMVSSGHSGLIYIRMPQIYRQNNQTIEDKAITASGNKDSTSVTLDTTAGNIQVGEFIRFSGHSKVYMVTTANGTAINVFPLLRVTISSATVYYGGRCTLNCKYDPSTQLGIRYSDGILMNPGSLKFIEDI